MKKLTLILKAFAMAIFVLGCTASMKNVTTKQEIVQLTLDYDSRIDSIIRQLTLQEKINLLHGTGMFWSGGVERLGIPELKYADGPLGIREEIERNSWKPLGWTNDSATFFPAGTALAATWNPELSKRYGEAIGQEARARDKDILLAPAINIIRSPLCGRNYEYMTEDPFLNVRMAVPYIQGVQEQDVAACVKHFAINNQETLRGSIDVLASERAIREIYLPAFKAAVTEGNAFSVMGAYNRFRGAYLCENDYLLNKLLKGEWGFKGIVVSDWGAVHNTVNSAKNGLDVEMGSGLPFSNFFFANPLLEAVQNGSVEESLIDDKVKRILRVMFNVKKMDQSRKKGSINTPEHSEVAYQVASEAVVLLKNNESILPVDLYSTKSIAVIGDNAATTFALKGFGAGVKTRYEVTALQGLKNRLGDKCEIRYAQGYKEKYLPGKRGQAYGRDVDYTPDEALISEAVRLAKTSDYAVIVAGSNRTFESESVDRKDLRLPFAQEELIKAVVKVNPKTIVVLITGAPYDIREINQVAPAIIWTWFNGSEGGNALADVLLGKVNPSGKLPFTLPEKLEDSPAHALNAFPGDGQKVEYLEDILVGYRWFDTKNINPIYCFGYGLSYTSFDISAPECAGNLFKANDTINVSLRLTNKGKMAGAEVVQLYIQDMEPKVLKAQKELKAFKKEFLQPGESKKIELKVPVASLAYFDEAANDWVVSPGRYKLRVGSSSRDIRGETIITVK